MLRFKVLVLKLLSVYRPAPGSVASGEVSALDHEALDHAMED